MVQEVIIKQAKETLALYRGARKSNYSKEPYINQLVTLSQELGFPQDGNVFENFTEYLDGIK